MTKHIAVLKGGMSSEREVSLVSGAECAKALRAEGYNVTEIDVAPNLWEQLHAADPDVVFNALHGDWGEDGRVQGVLDLFGAPYTHSGVMASALAMDKHRSKAVLRDVGINVPKGTLVSRHSASQDHPMEPPYVLKPNGQGSSQGVYIIKDDAHNHSDEIAANADMGDMIIAEEYIAGRELTVTVIDGKALAVTEIIPTSGWYDYEAKYVEGGSRHVVPAQIPDEVTETCKTWALLAHEALGCKGLTRSDFIFNDINEDLTDVVNKIVMLELNTQPGMTPTSLAPEQAAYDGMTFGQLCRWIVEDASWPR
ncbi:D-alanine--D-alanine ligase [Hellea balneolensis]|uniref:D-alanine--D-alanine ligase n=1 Tax=Hellea balneolensis TaxID=287478 RepID=UPI00047C7350|nr:D-alanine--D-alanine ligase [Hellea balneolensis]